MSAQPQTVTFAIYRPAKEPKLIALKSRYQYMVDVVLGLRELGGEASPQAIYEWIETSGLADPHDLVTIQTDGGTRFQKEVRWARKELHDAGIIRAPARGTWALTAFGQEAQLGVTEMRELIAARGRFRQKLMASGLTSIDKFDAPPRSPSEPTTGPIPSDWRGEVIRSTAGPADTYLVRFGQRDVWKVGHAKNVQERLRDINRHVPFEVLGEQWQLFRSHTWPNSLLAYQMEQAFLLGLTSSRTGGERVLSEPTRVQKMWDILVG